MWLALLVMLALLSLGLWLGVSVSTVQAPYLGLLILVLLDGGLRLLRTALSGRPVGIAALSEPAGLAVVVLGLAWLGERLSLGRVGGVPSFTLAIEIVLAARILGGAEDLRQAWSQPPERVEPDPPPEPSGEAGDEEGSDS